MERCGDCLDYTIVLLKVAEQAAIDRIVIRDGIQAIILQVTLRDDDKPQEFSLSRFWTFPRVFLRLAACPSVLFTFKLRVIDGYLTIGDLMIGLPVQWHLHVDTNTL